MRALRSRRENEHMKYLWLCYEVRRPCDFGLRFESFLNDFTGLENAVTLEFCGLSLYAHSAENFRRSQASRKAPMMLGMEDTLPNLLLSAEISCAFLVGVV